MPKVAIVKNIHPSGIKLLKNKQWAYDHLEIFLEEKQKL